MGFKKILVGAGLASSVLAGSVEKRGTLAFSPTIITKCTVPNTIAVTFDDGPYLYSQKIVDALTAAGHKATFFQNGANYDDINKYGSLLKSMIAGGHQIGSHTWSHADLTKLDAAGIASQMNQLEAAHIALIGKAPQYMRPPYLATNNLVISTLTSLKYHIISVTVDTQDWATANAGLISLSVDWFKGNVSLGGSPITLEHDVYQQTADTLVPAIIAYLDSLGKKSVTVGTCLGDDEANWYRGGSASASGSAPLATSGNLGKRPSGGDTEPGHGANAGSGALPGKAGTGNYGAASPSGSAAGNGSAKPSAVYPGPSTNGASTVTGGALALLAAAVFVFCL